VTKVQVPGSSDDTIVSDLIPVNENSIQSIDTVTQCTGISAEGIHHPPCWDGIQS
jgi:hypothetical protein